MHTRRASSAIRAQLSLGRAKRADDAYEYERHDVPLHYVAPNPGGNLWGASLDASSVRLLARLARPGDEVHVSVYTAQADAPEGHALRTTSVELARPSQKERAIVGSWIADARIISLALALE